MAKTRTKKESKVDEQGNTTLPTTPTETPAEANGTPTNTTPPVETQNGQRKNKPVVSYAASSDRWTRLEVALWPNAMTNKETGELYTQLVITIARNWRDAEGNWHQGGSYRVHDIPVLVYLVNQAYSWALSSRTEVKTAEDGIPF